MVSESGLKPASCFLAKSGQVVEISVVLGQDNYKMHENSGHIKRNSEEIDGRKAVEWPLQHVCEKARHESPSFKNVRHLLAERERRKHPPKRSIPVVPFRLLCRESDTRAIKAKKFAIRNII